MSAVDSKPTGSATPVTTVTLVERVASGRPVAHVAAGMGPSRATAQRWVRRWRTEGEAGLADRSGGPSFLGPAA